MGTAPAQKPYSRQVKRPRNPTAAPPPQRRDAKARRCSVCRARGVQSQQIFRLSASTRLRYNRRPSHGRVTHTYAWQAATYSRGSAARQTSRPDGFRERVARWLVYSSSPLLAERFDASYYMYHHILVFTVNVHGSSIEEHLYAPLWQLHVLLVTRVRSCPRRGCLYVTVSHILYILVIKEQHGVNHPKKKVIKKLGRCR